MKKTLIDLFEESVAKYGNNTFLLEKKTTKFEPTTYAEAHEQALAIGGGLGELGIDEMYQLILHKRAQLGVCQSLAVVGVDG